MTAFPALPRHDVALVIAGHAWLGWTALGIERALDQMAGSFELELTYRGDSSGAARTVKAGDRCEVVLGGDALITGYVDRVDRGVDAQQRTLRVTGRDAAADMVDCSAVHSPGSWSNAALATIASALAAPFGVNVRVTGDAGPPLKKFALQQGETAFAALERLARYRALIVTSDGRGGVMVGNPETGLRGGRIAYGVNLLGAEASSDHVERHSAYIIKGQSSGDDERNGKVVAQVKGEASDPALARYRPLLIIGEEQSTPAALKKRAEWEKTVRAARAETATVTVPGWFAGDSAASGSVWAPGMMAEIAAEPIGLSGDRLIERVRLTRDADGTRSELTLVPPGAWSQIAENEAAA